MTDSDITWLFAELEKNESKAHTLLSMIDGGYSHELLRNAVEELCNGAESLKLGCSGLEKSMLD